MLSCAIALEANRWDEVEQYDIDPAWLQEAYLNSTQEAFEGLHLLP
jgi:hypothetical protein